MVNGATIVFRVDASLQIGSGHVMRCLTLADALRAEGAECHFICREHSGNLLGFIKSKGFFAHKLPIKKNIDEGTQRHPIIPLTHGHWLGVTQEEDASASNHILEALRPDWLIVDHYALDAQWEKRTQQYRKKLIVIDDLADRKHLCDLLLDQNLGRFSSDYRVHVPQNCALLMGPSYALLRPEFEEWRNKSLKYRASPQLKRFLITMGGVDENNATCLILQALKNIMLPSGARITVVMGGAAPWLINVQRLAKKMPYPTEVVCNVDNMAERMSSTDLAIGAAGSTSWERCCLGLPTLIVTLADNQIKIGSALHDSGSAILLGRPEGPDFNIKIKSAVESIVNNPEMLKSMSAAASKLTDGSGCAAVVSLINE